MTMPAVIRIFFAIDLPASAKEKIGVLINTLKKKSRTNAIRWSKPENLHITLQFLAHVETLHLPKLITNVRERLQGAMKNSVLAFSDLQLFPNPYRPRVIVLAMASQEKVSQIAYLIGQGLEASNYAIEQRPFRAHLTLGRIKHMYHTNLNFLGDIDLLPQIEIPCEEVVLFRSEPRSEGSIYTVLEKIPLNSDMPVM